MNCLGQLCNDDSCGPKAVRYAVYASPVQGMARKRRVHDCKNSFECGELVLK